MSNLIVAKMGGCPYCSGVNLSSVTVSNPHPTRTVKLCNDCNRHSTMNERGKFYPHDDPSDPESLVATSVVFNS